jgi:ABC-type multidrug transport system ATPase subunit
MTVEDNLWYFCGLKLMTDQEIRAYIDKMLPKVSLEGKKNAVVSTLSGG